MEEKKPVRKKKPVAAAVEPVEIQVADAIIERVEAKRLSDMSPHELNTQVKKRIVFKAAHSGHVFAVYDSFKEANDAGHSYYKMINALDYRQGAYTADILITLEEV